MTDKNVQQETEKKPAARSRVSRGRTAGQSASAKRRREARMRQAAQQQQHGGMNGGGEREGSDYQTMLRIVDRICKATGLSYGELGIFGALNFLQQEQNGQLHHGQKTRSAGR
jgi:hypothetical protein